MGVADLAKAAQKITRNIEVKHKFTKDEKLAILQQITDANKIVLQKNLEVADLKDRVKKLNEEIGEQYDIISNLCVKSDAGYESKMVECSASYHGIEVTFTDINGEIVEQREMTAEEQLQLSEHRIDAENIIRQSEDEE